MSAALRLALIVLVAALFAFGARYYYAQSQQHTPTTIPERQVPIAAANLPAGLLLRDTDISWVMMPESDVPKGAIQADKAQELLKGALVRKALAADAIILQSDIVQADSAGFLAAVLKPDMRAISVEVDEVSGNAGLIQPGDYVDMILTQTFGSRNYETGEQLRQVVSETVVEKARIIAVGSTFQRNNDSAKPVRARTVTVEVQPRAAEAITVASQLGNLSLALRSFATDQRDAASQNDTGALVVAWRDFANNQPSGPVWGSDITQVIPNATQPSTNATPDNDASASTSRSTAPKPVVILRGSSDKEILD